MKLSLEVSGVDQIAREVERSIVKYEAATRVALYQVAVEIAAEAERLTPVSSGELQESMYVTAVTGRQPAVELGYGAEHAPIVHEEQWVHHEQGEAKFLQKAIDGLAASLLERLRGHIAANVERGGSAVFSSRFPAVPQINKRSQRRVATAERRRLKRQMGKLGKK